ncbi:MAG: redoxin family protein, partial [Planctomycetes bacterium]|nr:redoxin family protein [Planctomycetota bacterium]
LKPGMPAPEFRVESFLKGKPFTAFEKGRIYIVEFWATWCGPCVMSMPHLSELQREYSDKHVTICGVNVWQEKEYSPATLDTVTKFVQTKGDGMDYSVAYDGAAAAMAEHWLEAAGATGIPFAFVVDRAGTIAWCGHPSMLDMVLDEVTRGTWDIASGRDRLRAAAKAFTDAGEKYKESLAAGDAAWAGAMKQYPALGRTRESLKLGAMLGARHMDAACALGGQIIDAAQMAKTLGPIMEVLEALGDPALLEKPAARDLFLKAARANLELADGNEPGPHVLMAKAHFYAGQDDLGHAEAKRALDLAPAASRASFERWLNEIEAQAKQ